jgi:DNA-binding transcriptional LysR family regulator
MELYQLRTFVSVAELGHLTRAAERLHVSQPALSAQLKTLEDELGVVLFDRTPAGMILTVAGRRLLARAEKVLTAAQDLRNEASLLKGAVAGRIRLGSVSNPAFVRLGEILGRAVEQYPLLELAVHQEMSGAALAAVVDGRLDASLFFGEFDAPGLSGLPLTRMIYRIAAPAAWRGRVAGAGWQELAAMPWILTPPASTHSSLVRGMFRSYGLAPMKVVEADNESVLENLIASGVGLSLMREESALAREGAGDLCVVNDVRLDTILWVVYRTERAHEPAIEALLGVVRDVWPAWGEAELGRPGHGPKPATAVRKRI